jgi:superoxide dismutase, Fe-Mn family
MQNRGRLAPVFLFLICASATAPKQSPHFIRNLSLFLSIWSDTMAFELPALPYPKNALEPHISARTMEIHHGKHHRAYLDALNQMVAGTVLADRSLEEIMRATAKDEAMATVFNNAAQAWNHDFFWHSLAPKGGTPSGEISRRIDREFGGLAKFNAAFMAAGLGQFGSGWVWLTLDRGQLRVIKTANAINPLILGQIPLLACDVWEHAYYLDYQNQRADFLETFVDALANWEFAARNLERAGRGRAERAVA